MLQPQRESIKEIAKLVIVRILTLLEVSSGVITSRQGQTYTVLTNAHVVEENQDDRYTVLTADGRFSYREAAPTHSAQLPRSPTMLDKNIHQVATMTLTDTDYKHIVLDDHNVPIIAGTSMKVIELITSVKAYGWSPEELHDNYPHLSMSKIYSALAYYWDHKEKIDNEIEQEAQWAAQARRAAGESPFVARLRAQGLLQ